MINASQKAGAEAKDETAARIEIEAQIARVRAELAALGGMIGDYGSDRLRGAEFQALEELQHQLSALEARLRRKMHDQPMQMLGLAAMVGLVVGLVLRR